ncbi:MAG: T9SS type A sorting domain-containing protein [Bacteroidia bacterium]
MRKPLAYLTVLLSGLAWGQQPPLVTIEEIQTPRNLAAGNDTSVLHGQRVRVRGVVLTRCEWHRHFNPDPPSNNYRCSIWLLAYDQANNTTRRGPRTGLQIRRQNNTDQPPNFTTLQPGQHVELVGTVSYFQGEIQLLVDINTPPQVLEVGIPISRPVEITLTDLNNPDGSHNMAVGDQWQGSLVKVRNLTVVNVTANPWRLTVRDQNGNQGLIFGEFKGLNGANFPVGTRLDSVIGIVLHYYPPSGTPLYEICPWHDSLLYVGDPVPRINSLTRQPVCPPPGTPVRVQVDAVSGLAADPIAGATLYYAIGTSTTYTAVPMTQVGASSTYEASIPAQSEGTYVHYYVEVRDQSGDRVRFPRFEPQSYRVNAGGCRITDIQYVIPSVLYAYNPTGRRDYLGSGYSRLTVENVPGVVTATENDLGYIYIQQPGATEWAGIWVRPQGQPPTLAIGDSVVVTTAEVDEYFGLTNLRNAQLTRIGPARSHIEPILLPLNLVYGDTQYAATEPYESMLVRFRHTNPTQPLFVVQPKISTQFPHAGDYRVGMDPAEPLKGIRVLAGRQTNNIFSSLCVSYVNDSTWATTDGLINPTIRLCVVGDTTEMDSLQGILTYQWSFIKLLPRTNADFFRVLKTPCGTQSPGECGVTQSLAVDSRSLKVFPNPTSGYVEVLASPELGEINLILYTLLGQKIWERRFRESWRGFLGDLPAGVYILQAVTEGGTAVVRILKY